MPEKGWVHLVGSYGGDEDIERAARQSFDAPARGGKAMAKLIDRLARDGHSSPFEAVDITIQFHVPIFVARQILRHRLFSVNELSGRYSRIPEEAYLPRDSEIRAQSLLNKQGSGEVLPRWKRQLARQTIRICERLAFVGYNTLLRLGVSREMARIVLPLATYTTFTLKGNLRTWLHFLKLRLAEDVQPETRAIAMGVNEIIATIAPVAHAAWEKYGRQI